jgi:murein DD-endopeptidase MepM/ murein hydrolase activator NlpD
VKFLVLALVAGLLVGCASPKPYRSGRTGFIDRLNRGGPGMGRAPAGSRGDDGVTEAREAHEELVAKLKPAVTGWNWPLADVHVTSPFGRRGKDFHEGIDLRARVGTPVYAVDAGRVLYAGRRIRGYGNMVVVRHRSGLASVYAHNSKLLVRLGQAVKKGQKIAVSGKTGHAKGPHLHFEIRSGVAAVDPQLMLAGKKTARAELPEPKAKRTRANRYARYAGSDSRR